MVPATPPKISSGPSLPSLTGDGISTSAAHPVRIFQSL
jgi:hypothetical protein